MNFVRLFEKALRGMMIPAAVAVAVKQTLSDLIQAKESSRLFLLIKLLTELSQVEQPLFISGKNEFQFDPSEDERVNRIYNYAFAHFWTKSIYGKWRLCL